MTQQAPQESTPSKPIILVIEDSPDDWFLIRWNLLQHFPQTQIVWLRNADEVIPYLENRSRLEEDLPKLITVDLYLLDYKTHIPTAHAGIRVIQALKSHYLYQQIPLVTLSWSAHADDISEALKYSTNSYMVKPNDQLGWPDIFTELHKYWPRQELTNKANS